MPIDEMKYYFPSEIAKMIIFGSRPMDDSYGKLVESVTALNTSGSSNKDYESTKLIAEGLLENIEGYEQIIPKNVREKLEEGLINAQRQLYEKAGRGIPNDEELRELVPPESYRLTAQKVIKECEEGLSRESE